MDGGTEGGRRRYQNRALSSTGGGNREAYMQQGLHWLEHDSAALMRQRSGAANGFAISQLGGSGTGDCGMGSVDVLRNKAEEYLGTCGQRSATCPASPRAGPQSSQVC